VKRNHPHIARKQGPAAKQIAAHAFQRRVIDLSYLQADLLDTAAILHNVDLLISVDTAALHLAGALGRPAWGLIARAQDFRWLLERDDSPWYPTLRLFRQARYGEWGPVVERVTAELARWRLTAAPAAMNSISYGFRTS
jgi:ADP-heptose:LPS heptosyltransferase